MMSFGLKGMSWLGLGWDNSSKRRSRVVRIMRQKERMRLVNRELIMPPQMQTLTVVQGGTCVSINPPQMQTLTVVNPQREQQNEHGADGLVEDPKMEGSYMTFNVCY